MLNGIENEDVAVVELLPVDAGQLSDDRLSFALDDEQLRLLLVTHHVQAGGNAAVQNSGNRIIEVACWFQQNIQNYRKDARKPRGHD